MARQTLAKEAGTVKPPFVFPPSETLSYQEAELTSGSSLYLVNPGQPVGDRIMYTHIMFTIIQGNGQSVNISLPATWVPMDVSTQISKKELLGSPDFRRFVMDETIIILKESFALDMLKTPEAKAEVARNKGKSSKSKQDEYFTNLARAQSGDLSAQEDPNKPKPRVNPLSGAAGVTTVFSKDSNEPPRAELVSQVAESPDVRAELLAIVRDKFSDETAMLIISRHQNSLTLDETNYLIKNVKNEQILDLLYTRLGTLAQRRSA